MKIKFREISDEDDGGCGNDMDINKTPLNLFIDIYWVNLSY